MNKHVRIHSKQRPFECDKCGKTFTDNSNFTAHLRCHPKSKKIYSEENDWKCTECEYTSACSSNLKRHMRIHSGLKPFKCNICNYESTTSTNLKSHMKRHEKLENEGLDPDDQPFDSYNIRTAKKK